MIGAFFKPLSVALVGGALLTATGPWMASAQSGAQLAPVTDAMLQAPAPDDWLMWRRTLDSWGFSPLDQVNRSNVDQLRMVWTRDLAQGTSEITPLAYGGVVWVPQNQDVIQALDAVAGDLLWEYDRDIPEDLYGLVGANASTTRRARFSGRSTSARRWSAIPSPMPWTDANTSP